MYTRGRRGPPKPPATPPTAQDPDEARSTILIKEGRYFSQIWFVADANHAADWLAALFRDPGGPWRFNYRLRVYVDDKAHNSADRKNGGSLTCRGEMTEQAALASVNQLVAEMERLFGGLTEKLVLRTADPEKIIATMRSSSFFHLKMG